MYDFVNLVGQITQYMHKPAVGCNIIYLHIDAASHVFAKYIINIPPVISSNIPSLIGNVRLLKSNFTKLLRYIFLNYIKYSIAIEINFVH